jgi:hypothetical protein
VYGPFELLLHAELHYRAAGDFDRRIALISFDNSIEVSVMNYLSLDEIHRKGRKYKKEDRETWTNNLFATKLDFIEAECASRSITPKVDKAHMLWYHKIRNKQYHEGEAAVPAGEVLSGIRDAAIWVFGLLYDVADVEAQLNARILALTPPTPQRDDASDKILDDEYGVIWIGETSLYASELLFAYDPVAYQAIALELADKRKRNEDR